MKDKIAILDVDGVLLNVTPGAIKYVKAMHGATITEDNITDWDWDYCLGLPEGMTDDLWKAIWGTPALVYPGALKFIQELKARGYYVQGLSNRFGLGVRASERDFPQLGLDSWILSKKKANWILENMPHAEFVVEDYNKNAVNIGLQTNLDVYFLDRPWNKRCISVTNSWERVYGYGDILWAIDLMRKR